jgi:hypothetical protein
MIMENWQNSTDRETKGLKTETCPSSTLSTTNPTRTGLGSSPGFHNDRKALTHSHKHFVHKYPQNKTLLQ